MRYDHDVLTELDYVLSAASHALSETQRLMHKHKSLTHDEADRLLELSEELGKRLAQYDRGTDEHGRGVGMTTSDVEVLRRLEDHATYLLQWLEDAA